MNLVYLNHKVRYIFLILNFIKKTLYIIEDIYIDSSMNICNNCDGSQNNPFINLVQAY